MEMAITVAAGAALLALASLLCLIPLAPAIKLLDIPTQRKAHVGEVPLIGGLSAFIGMTIAWLIMMPTNDGYGLFLLCSAVLVVMGSLDDALDISARLRLAVQILLGAVLCYGSGIYLTTFGNVLGIGNIDLFWLGPLVTIAAIIGATNAYNMIDGIDGLAGSMSLVTLSSLAVLFGMIQGFNKEFTLALVMIMALLPYMAANLKIPPFKRKVFMGDAGSIFIGFSIVWLLVNGTYDNEKAFRPVTALWVCAIPLMDMVAIMIRRARKGQSVMMADRDHLHHIFLRAGFSDRQALAIISICAITLAAIGIVGELFNAPEWIMFAGFLLIFWGYNLGLKYIWRLLVIFRK